MRAKIYTLYGFGIALGVTGALCGIINCGTVGIAEQLMNEAIEILLIIAGLVFCAFGEKLANKQDGEGKEK